MRPLDFEPIAEIARKSPEREAYWIRSAKLLFGLVYVTPDAYTFAWTGEIEFSHLDKEALSSLPMRIMPEGNGWNLRAETTVSLILPNQLVRCHLGKPDEEHEYLTVLQDPSQILFARYDVGSPHLTSQPWYTFTAENPQYSDGAASELTVQLPRTHRFSQALVDWVVEHHANKANIHTELSASAFLATLWKLVSPNETDPYSFR